MRLSDRIQEWLADRVSWVQYPQIRPADARTRAAGTRWKVAMPFPQRVLIGAFGIATVVIAGGGLIVFLWVAWQFVRAAFTT